MKKILIIGGGAMGSAFTFPCIDNKNEVTITEPYNKTFIKNLSSKKKYHSSLKINLPNKLIYKKYSTHLLTNKYDLVVVALSLSGINFISEEFKKELQFIKTPKLSDLTYKMSFPISHVLDNGFKIGDSVTFKSNDFDKINN